MPQHFSFPTLVIAHMHPFSSYHVVQQGSHFLIQISYPGRTILPISRSQLKKTRNSLDSVRIEDRGQALNSQSLLKHAIMHFFVHKFTCFNKDCQWQVQHLFCVIVQFWVHCSTLLFPIMNFDQLSKPSIPLYFRATNYASSKLEQSPTTFSVLHVADNSKTCHHEYHCRLLSLLWSIIYGVDRIMEAGKLIFIPHLKTALYHKLWCEQ